MGHYKKSQWNQSDVDSMVAHYAKQGIAADLAIRVYSTRLIGQDPELVLHGGGNTSVKTQWQDFDGSQVDVLCVKGSGWDMATIEPAGLPAVKMDTLLKLSTLDKLSDEEMVAQQRRALLDPNAPNPSIEAILHALVPTRYVDHCHANAIVSLTNQPDGDKIIQDLLPDAVQIPYVMAGFDLAKATFKALGGLEKFDTVILMQHGLITCDDDPRVSYEKTIEIIDRCMARLENGGHHIIKKVPLPTPVAALEQVAPIVRGALSKYDSQNRSWILEHRISDEIANFCAGEDLADYAMRGNATPDHSIRIKRFGVVLPAPDANALDDFTHATHKAIEKFTQDYAAYFTRNNQRHGQGLTMLDPVPRVVYIPAIGLFGVGISSKAAKIAADIAESTVRVIADAEQIGKFTPLPEKDLFDIEYWSLEQAKLAKIKEAAFSRKVVVVTGAASGLGLAIAKTFRNKGAEVALLDRDGDKVMALGKELNCLGIACDVTLRQSVDAAFGKICATFGGVDILISNAGGAFAGDMLSLDDTVLAQSLAVNLWGHQYAAQAAVGIMKQQGTGGCLLFNITKQALNPGKGFGAYGIAKSAALNLMRQYALEHGPDGITANAVNADRIRSGLLNDDMISKRANARGCTPETYMKGNLLSREVTAEDVADAFVNLASMPKTTGAILTVDGGNVAAMVR